MNIIGDNNMTWENVIKEVRISNKSKFWGDINHIPNEISRIFNNIKELSEEERNSPEIQKDIKYMIALSKKFIPFFEEILEEFEWVGKI